MELRFQLSPAVTLRTLPDGNVEVSNGADLLLSVSARLARVLETFRSPTRIESLTPDPSAREALTSLALDLESKLVLVRAEQSPQEEMRRVWDYLSTDVERAVFHIDNDSRTLDEFRQSGEEAVRALARWVEFHRDLRVLTIGCGMGRLEKSLASLVGHIAAYDISAQMLAHARHWLSGISNVELIQTDGRLGPTADRSVDLVASFLVFQHVTKEGTWQYFQEAARVLKPHGHFFFQIHCYPEGVEAPRVLSSVERYYGSGKAAYHESEVRAQLTHHGFEVEAWRDGETIGDEVRLTGTAGPWRSVLVKARRDERP